MNVLSRLLAAAVMTAATVATAQTVTVGDIQIDRPWARATVAGIPNGAAYFGLKNSGSDPDFLVSASSPVADRAELHTHIKEGEVSKMRQVHDVEVPANGEVAFQPGGLHVMLLGLTQPLEQDSSFPLTLVFEKAGAVTVEVDVDRMGGSAASHQDHDHGDHAHDHAEHDHAEHDHGEHDHGSHKGDAH